MNRILGAGWPLRVLFTHVLSGGLFSNVTSDGKGLRTRMRKDTEEDDDSEEDSPDSDMEDDGPFVRLDLESEYHYLKENIFKLLQEYEVPKVLGPESESKTFSNRTGNRHPMSRPRLGRRSDAELVPEDSKPLPAHNKQHCKPCRQPTRSLNLAIDHRNTREVTVWAVG